MGLPVDGHLTFLHAFEQAGLGAGYRAINFICKQHIRNDGARMEFKTTRLLIINIKAGDVGRQEIRCELNPIKGTPDAFCQGFCKQRFGDPRDILQQHMALGQEGHQKQFDRTLFPYNHTGYILRDSVAEAEVQGVHLTFDGSVKSEMS